ncbi:MAG: hypothetical protein U0168_09720 [Nannocystaceae bacterium]
MQHLWLDLGLQLIDARSGSTAPALRWHPVGPPRDTLAGMLDKLSHDERLTLLEFVCSFVWVDLEVRPEERKFVMRMVEKLGLQQDRAQIERWLERPPPAEDVDPTRIPHEHRALFLKAARDTFKSDKHFDESEQEYLELLEQLLV